MEPEGIGKACESIRNALSDFHKNDVSLIRGFVTAPARGINNSDELIRSVRETGLSLQILSGKVFVMDKQSIDWKMNTSKVRLAEKK